MEKKLPKTNLESLPGCAIDFIKSVVKKPARLDIVSHRAITGAPRTGRVDLFLVSLLRVREYWHLVLSHCRQNIVHRLASYRDQIGIQTQLNRLAVTKVKHIGEIVECDRTGDRIRKHEAERG